jgi:cobalt-zinc-cadmium resistance protein CzcA
VTAAQANQVLRCALQGKTLSRMMEGEKEFDITMRWPAPQRRDEQAILDLPMDVVNDQPAPLPGAAVNDPIANRPRLRLRDLVSPMDEKGPIAGSGVSAIYRENGKRRVLLRLVVRGRAQSAVRIEAEQALTPLLEPGYSLDWDCGR